MNARLRRKGCGAPPSSIDSARARARKFPMFPLAMGLGKPGLPAPHPAPRAAAKFAKFTIWRGFLGTPSSERIGTEDREGANGRGKALATLHVRRTEANHLSHGRGCRKAKSSVFVRQLRNGPSRSRARRACRRVAADGIPAIRYRIPAIDTHVGLLGEPGVSGAILQPVSPDPHARPVAFRRNRGPPFSK